MRRAPFCWAVLLACPVIHASHSPLTRPTRDVHAASLVLDNDLALIEESSKTLRHAESDTDVDAQAPQPQEPPLPVPTIDGLPPVATAMKCVISMSTLFFVVYTMLFALQAANGLGLLERVLEEKYLASAAETVFFVPMLCILFLAARMRAVQLAQGDTERYDLPQWWCKWAMIMCFWFLLAQTVLTLVCAFLYGEWWEDNGRRHGLTGKILSGCRYGIIGGIYVSFSVVCLGICTMSAPPEVWGVNMGPPVSPAVFCTMFLSVQYFTVYAALALARTVSWSGLFGDSLRFGYWQDVLKQATTTVAFAPMLCVLFVAVRLRALQIDPTYGHPEPWVQTCFYICTFGVTVLTGLVLVGALALQGHRPKLIGQEQEAEEENSTQDVKRALELTRWCVMACLYGALIAVIISLPLQEIPQFASVDDPAGIRMPAPLRSVVVLVAAYFSVYLAMWLVTSYRKFSPGEVSQSLRQFCNFLGGAQESVDFSPMLCVLFLGTMLRAMQITGGRGAPQDWVQDAMWVTCWALIFHTIARVDLALEGAESATLSQFFAVMQYVCLLVMYVGACMVVIGLFSMTPETAIGRGSLSPSSAHWVVHV
mmetsp:Transcript_70539/g.131960  ORF Transcript_70539/g.131960 Transcript_70539/m.131960 type:complete len:595 (+) Transcript_70539:88-1872(+)